MLQSHQLESRMSKPSKKAKSSLPGAATDYSGLVSGVSELLDAARRTSVRSVNALMTATYWEVGRRIVEFEQGGGKRAEYGSPWTSPPATAGASHAPTSFAFASFTTLSPRL